MFGNRRFKHVGIALLLGGACACSQQKSTGIDFDSAGFEGFDETHFDLLASDCSYSSGDMTLTVAANETAYVFKRASDSLVVANANIAGVECTLAAGKKLTITGGAGDQKVIIDFYSGTFNLATTATPNIAINLGGGTGDTVKIRGTTGNDLVTFGTNAGGTSFFAIGTVGATPARTYADISMTGVESIVVSTGAGNDTITGQGGAAMSATTGAPVLPLAGTISLTVYGGEGDDTITSGAASSGGARNALYGGVGNDLFLQQAAFAADSIFGGAGVDTVDYGNRTTAIRATLGATTVAAAASGSLTCVAKASIADNDNFVIGDGTHTAKTFAYQVSADAYATGSIACTAQATLHDNDWFTLNDGTKSVTFEYDVTGTASAIHGGTLINVSGATDGPSVAALTYTAINAAQIANTIDITPTDPGVTAIIPLTADAYGAGSSITNTTTVVADGFTVVDMHGGSAFVESAGNIAASATIIDISSGVTTAIEVCAATYTPVAAANGGSFAVTATDPSGGTVIALVNDATGAAGNVTITKSTGAAFTVSGMSGGVTGMTNDDGDIAGLEADSIDAAVENIIGSSAADTIDASQSDVAHVLMGMDGADTLIGGPGHTNYLYGGKGNDTLIGGGVVDYLVGGNDDDVLRGGLGNDNINGGGVNCVATVSTTTAPIVPFVNATVCTSTTAAAGTAATSDTIDYSDRALAVYVDLTNLTNCTTHPMGEIVANECDVIVTSGTPAVASVKNIRGGSAGDTLKGDSRDNIIWGGAGGDTISGGLGNDALYGEAGNDTINGNDGTNTALTSGQTDNDYINGGTGTNTLNGDDGLDTIDSSQGTTDAVNCGLGDGDINLPSGSEASVLSCEL